MAHTKAKGTSKLGRDSNAKRLGVKLFGGQNVKAGNIIIRQRGSKFYTGDNTAIGKDDTIYAKTPGVVQFQSKAVQSYTGKMKRKFFVSVIGKTKAGKVDEL